MSMAEVVMLKVVVMQDPRVGFDWLDAVPILQSEAKVLIVKVGFDCFAFTIKTKSKKEIMSIANLFATKILSRMAVAGCKVNVTINNE